MNTFTGTSRTIALVCSIVGGIVLLGVGVTAAASTVGALTPGTGTQTLDLGSGGDNIARLDVTSNAADFEVIFDDVSEAQLDVTGNGATRWNLGMNGDRLSVTSSRGLFNFCVGWCNFGEQQVTLTLPKSLESGKLAANFEVNAGTFTAGGNWTELDTEVNAGTLNFDGTASTVDVGVSAGRANLDIAGVRDADLSVSAGQLLAEFSGSAPKSVAIDVSAGRLELAVPRGSYDVRSDVSAGSLDNRLDTASSSANRISVDVSAGSAILRNR